MATDNITIQSNIKNHTNDGLTNYALFLSGTNVAHDVLANYDPLTTGYGRLFMVRKPVFLDKYIPNKLKKFKHMLEYCNTSVSGINDITMQFNQIQGGYAAKGFEIPSYAQDDTNSFTVNLYEFSGSPVREVIYTWLNGTRDFLTTFAHYNGLNLPKNQANHTAEFIYVATDNTGKEVEYACMFCNCMPKNVKNDHWNYNSGEHNLVEYNVEFTCTKYEGLQINSIAKQLINKYKILTNSLNFNSGIKTADLGSGAGYDYRTGKYTASASGIDTDAPIQSLAI